MTIYKKWVAETEKKRDHEATDGFWEEYFQTETDFYKELLENPEKTFEDTFENLAKHFGRSHVLFMGFLDGINSSLKQELDLDSIKEDTKVKLDIDFEKLYLNMQKAKAPWLYNLKQWDAVLPINKRNEIAKEYRKSTIAVSEKTVGRNDPCPCGSGKKYKKCCGKNEE